jgi:Rrf2 family transcriptional regulator, nitric oxide-sensitive transcriptional repressor
MTHGVPISDAVSLALHSVAYIAARDGQASVHDISMRLDVSENHLSKVLQQLAKNGLVKSTRGPRGGFSLARKSESLTLLHVYEAIEGPLKTSACMMRRKTCGKSACIFGDAMETMQEVFRNHLKSTRISDISEVYRQEANA